MSVPGCLHDRVVATGGSSAATTGASCGSFRGGGGAGGVGGGIAAAVAGDGIVAEGEVAAAAVRAGSPNGGRRRSARVTGTKVSEGGIATRQGYQCCSVEGTGTGRSCAAGSVPGFWGRCWFSSQDYPSEPAPAAESPQGCFQFSNDLVSSH